MSDSAEFLRWFKDIKITDRPSVGGKGASLGELTGAGISVPPGFVVTTSAFERFLKANDAEGTIRKAIQALRGESTEAIKTGSAEIRERVRTMPFPEDSAMAVGEAHATLCEGDARAPVAVRSSATSEDSAEASFAGLQDTYLWVQGADNVIQSIRDCWASLYSTESVSYRLRLDLPEDQIAMGVVVQRMVMSRASGVMFTRSPTTGDRSMIAIEGSWGLGSAIVSGEVTPDTFLVNKVTGEIRGRTISDKTRQHVPDVEKGGVRDIEVEEDQRNVACVSDEELGKLAEIGKGIERHYGSPQDIEWAVDQSGAIYLLQSRPETVWANKDAKPVADTKSTAMDHVFAAFGKR